MADPQRTETRREPTGRRLTGAVAKAFQKMNILVLTDDYAFGARLARQGEAQHLALSLYWSPDMIRMAGLEAVDAAVVDARLWPEARPALTRGEPTRVIVLLEPLAEASASTPYPPVVLAEAPDVQVVRLPRSSPPDAVLGAVADAAQRYWAEQERAAALVAEALPEPALGTA